MDGWNFLNEKRSLFVEIFFSISCETNIELLVQVKRLEDIRVKLNVMCFNLVT